jgi:hypothetical protein
MLIGKRNVIPIDVDLQLHRSQERFHPAIDRNYFIVNWVVDVTYACVRPPFVVLTVVHFRRHRQIVEHQSIEWNADFIYWPTDRAQRIVRCRFE